MAADRPADDPVEDRPRLSRLRRLSGQPLLATASASSRSAAPRPIPLIRDLFDITANSPQDARDKFVRTILRIEYEFGGGIDPALGHRLSSAANTNYRADLDGTATGNTTFFDNVDERAFSQEFNLISPDNQRFTWLLGAYAQWNNYHFLRAVPVPDRHAAGQSADRVQAARAPIPSARSRCSARSASMITPSLKIEIGGRYTDEPHDQPRRGHPVRRADRRPSRPPDSNNFSYKVVARLGGRAPTNSSTPSSPPASAPAASTCRSASAMPAPFEPGEGDLLRAGWKANFAGGHIRTTVNGFYNDYRNFQVIIGYPTFPMFGIELNVPGHDQDLRRRGRDRGASRPFRLRCRHQRAAQRARQLLRHRSARGRLPALRSRDTGPASATCLNLERPRADLCAQLHLQCRRPISSSTSATATR